MILTSFRDSDFVDEYSFVDEYNFARDVLTDEGYGAQEFLESVVNNHQDGTMVEGGPTTNSNRGSSKRGKVRTPNFQWHY